MKAKYIKKLRRLDKAQAKATKERKPIKAFWYGVLIFVYTLINDRKEIKDKYFPNYRGEWEKQNVLLDAQHKRILDGEADMRKIYEKIHDKCYREKTNDHVNKLTVDDIIEMDKILSKYIK